MKTIAFSISLALLAITTSALADLVIEQASITGQADYGTGQGQSFLLPSGKTAAAIQLHIGSVGSGGGSIMVRLWRATGGPGSYFTRMGTVPLATGTLDCSNVVAPPDWFTILLDNPFTNETGSPVYLVFEIELLTSGSKGWNNYSFSNLNSYSGGHSVYWDGSLYAIRDGQDLTFRILDGPVAPPVPVPLIEIDFTPASKNQLASVEIFIRESLEGYDYTCFMSTDLIRPRDQWDKLWTERGWGGVVSWGVGYSNLPDAHFFFVKAARNEEYQNKVVEPTR